MQRNKTPTPPSAGPSGSPNPWLISALIVGVAVVGGSLIIRSALQRATDQMGEIRMALNDTKQALVSAAQARPPVPAAPPTGPDPNRRYTVNTAGSPARGPATARIKIVEFSDFQ